MGLPNWVESLLHQYRGDGGGELPLRPGSALPPPEDSLAAVLAPPTLPTQCQAILQYCPDSDLY